MTCLQRFLRSKKLKWLEIDILLIVDDIRESYQIRGNLYNDFYESLVEDDWEIRGQTRLNQAMIVKLRDRQRGLQLLNDARDSYTKANSYSGTLYVAYRRVHLSTEESGQDYCNLSRLAEPQVPVGWNDHLVFRDSNEVMGFIVNDPELLGLETRIAAEQFMVGVAEYQDQFVREQFRLLHGQVANSDMIGMLWRSRNILRSYLKKHPSAATLKLHAIALDSLARFYCPSSDYNWLK